MLAVPDPFPNFEGGVRLRQTSVCVCVCVCLCVQAAHLRLTQLSDKLDILTDLVSCWLQNEFGVFRIIASFRSIRPHGSRPFDPYIYYARDFTRAVNLYAHV